MIIRAQGNLVVLVVKKTLLANADVKDRESDPWVGKIPGEGHGNPLSYSSRENPMDRGAWWAIVHRVTKSRT